MIKQEGSKWCVYSAEGAKLGEYDTEEAARERAGTMPAPKRDGERVHRIDTVEDADLAPPKRLENGFLQVDARLTRTGVFAYRNKDGTTRRELRLPEEVFRPESMRTFNLLPVTDEHPPAFLTADNAREYQRGSIGETVRDQRDQRWMRGPIMVTDAGLVGKMDKGEQRQVSLGYTCELEWKPGEYEGEKYDCIQRDIQGNHVAIVEVARAGPGARVRMDSADEAVISVGGPTRGSMATKIKIGGIEYEAGSEAAVQATNQLQARLDSLEAEAKKTREDSEAKAKAAQAEADKAKARADAAEEEAKKAVAAAKAAPEAAEKAIRARMALEGDARVVLGRDAKLDGLSVREVQAKVLKQAQPELNLDGKSDDYVQARFEIAVEQAREDAEDPDGDAGEERGDGGRPSASARARAGEGGLDADEPEPDGKRSRHIRGDATEADYKEHSDRAEAYEAMVRRSRTAWQKPLSENKPAF